MNKKVKGLWALLLLFLLCTTVPVYLYAQEEPEPESTSEKQQPVAAPTRALTPEQKRIDMDIRTSTLSELAAWCRSVGLAEGGTSADLARRLRDFYSVAEQTMQTEDKRKVITIESARSSEYFTIQAVDEDYARLSGEVRISLKDGDAIHRIRAWNILFNRTRNIISASGGVEYIKEEGEKIETFRGESITVDLDNWSSVFLGGVSERSLQSDNTVYKFSGTVISRDEEEVTLLNKAVISSANNEESLWSLSASRVWLLPGSDFAILNGLLKVGEIPVMYIPFFYYPADEVIFHPVIGSRTREGSFFQTTTYLLGRPKATTSAQSSLTKILGNSNDMQKKREGLFLRSTGKKVTDPDKVSLRMLLDHYVNLGFYFGTDLDLPAMKMLAPMNLSLGVGVTRPIGKSSNGNYTPFFPDYDSEIKWDESNLFGATVPFRYRLTTGSSIRGKYGSFTWSLPFYSDPMVDSDFLSRAEDMDWVNMIQKGAAMDEIESSQTQLWNYSWQFTTQFVPSFPQMTPYITGISISSITHTLSFRKKDVDLGSYSFDDIRRYAPNSAFYAPDTFTLYSLSASVAGTPFSLGKNTASQANTKTADTEPPDDPLINIGVPRSPFEKKENEEAKKKDQADKLVPPELNQRFDMPRIGNTSFSVDYRFAPSSASTLKYNYGKWKEYDDIDWDVSSILTNIGGEASTTLNFNHSENLFTNAFIYTGTGTWRQYGYLNEESDEFSSSGAPDPTKINNAKIQEAKQSFFSTSYQLTSSLRPLYWNDIFKSSSLQYNLKGLAVRSKFNEEDSTGDNLKYDMDYGEWEKEKIDIHQFTTTLSALVMDKTQTISLSADLPPKDAVISWRTGFRIGVTETDTNMRILFPGEEEKRKLEPFSFTERILFGTFGNFTQTVVLDTEDWDHSKDTDQLLREKLTTLTSSLNLTKWGLSATYTASRMLGYEYIPGTGSGTGWVQKTGIQTLQSRDFSLNFSKNLTMKDLWNKRMQFTVNTSSRLFFDLQRYTSSNFTFSLGFTMGITKFFDLSMSANSENASIFRYFKDIPPFNSVDMDIRGENNVFFDLLNSFRFDDEELRKSSSFKMKNFRIAATHYLGDWNAILNWTMSPYRPPTSRRFEINNEVTFLLQWIPVSEIKSDISYNKRNIPEWSIKQ
jgi:lipopolysaccharide assembly outer membrane protein LptD (OstA)